MLALIGCAEHKDLILDCLKDDDVTIRMRALDLITQMVPTAVVLLWWQCFSCARR